jgi:mRNA-degrading endonuclease YafQ of YafQ-DinJ toxin-antitoxin module
VKRLIRTKLFEKNYKKRIRPNKQLDKQFESRLVLFLKGKHGYPLDDHALKGKLQGKRAFSVANDIRVVYEETTEAYIFLDIGSHNQVYN